MLCRIRKAELKKAIRQAESIRYAEQREKLQLKCFSSAASSFHPGGNLSTENGTIVVANQEMGHILNINERLILNKGRSSAVFLMALYTFIHVP